jgi:hypothetical protein
MTIYIPVYCFVFLMVGVTGIWIVLKVLTSLRFLYTLFRDVIINLKPLVIKASKVVVW